MDSHDSEAMTPTIIVRKERGSQVVKFACAACSEIHTHGAPRDDKPEHRVSHCRIKNAYPNGYFIKVAG